jgi:putative ABC transport system permease protein
LSLAALAGGVGLASVILPVFNRFAGRSIRLDLLGRGAPLLVLVVLAVLLGAAAGSYPGWYLSRLRPLDLFRGTFFLGRRGGLSRTLLAFQFAISIFLVITTVALDRQHRHLLRFDLGYRPERVVALDLRPLTARFQASSRFFPVLKSRLLGHPGILSVSGATSGMSSWSARMVKHEESGKMGMLRFNEVDPDIRETLGLQLSRGRWFSSDHPSDAAEAVVVNEAFVRFFSEPSPVGRPLSEFFPTRSPQRIIGVVRDFHFDSLRRAVDPAMISLGEERFRRVYVRLDGRDLRSAMEAIERDFKAVAPGYPFLFSFLDEDVARQYASESRWSLMATVVSLLAVLIACAGVFALVVQSTARKTKEIGVRRVLGASVSQIVGLLGGEYVRLAAAACLLACPVAFLAVRKILNAYPYRIAVGPWLFLSGGLLVTVLVLATVGLQAVHAARANPVDSLRRE